MNPLVTAILLSAGIMTAVTAAEPQVGVPPSPPEQIFRSATDLVVLHVSVFDGRSNAVPSLPQSAFQVFENDKPQEISFFSNADVPVAVGLVVDNSSSMIARRGMVVAGGTAFAESSHPEDELFTIHFNENVRFGLPGGLTFTNRQTLLQAALSRYPAGGKTALHDAVIAGLDHLEGASHQKRVLVVLSDGDDNASRYSEQAMMARARAGDTIVYTVSNTNGREGTDGNAGVLRRLADATGGVAYFPRSEAAVVSTFRDIAGNIRRAYSIGYVPADTNHSDDYRRVRVSVRVPGRAILRLEAVMAIQRLITPAPDNEWGPLPPHATPGRRRVWMWLERALLTLGLVLLGYFGYVSIESRLYQAFENRELDTILANHREAPATPDLRIRPAAGTTLGRIEIPRLGVSAVIRVGTDARTLRLAVGHISGTALPGEPGNVGLAGHRDTFFRRLGDIHADDEIRVVTLDGTFTYVVERTNVVMPQDTWVLDAGEEPALTLVTCYPFTFIGSAPQRFIVRAREKQS